MGTRAALVICAAALALAGCAEQTTPPPTTEVTRATWANGPWPFTVDDGVLRCHGPDQVTFTANGTEYALTDDARWLGHYQDVKAILVEGYVDMGNQRQPIASPVNPKVVDEGRDLCAVPHASG